MRSNQNEANLGCPGCSVHCDAVCELGYIYIYICRMYKMKPVDVSLCCSTSRIYKVKPVTVM